MAFEIPGLSLGVLPANSDLSDASTYQYAAVKAVAASAGIGPAAAAVAVASTGDPALGIMQNNPQANEAAAVMTSGVSKAKAGATISVGDKLMASTNGILVPATSGNFVIAIALEAAVVGDIFTVLLASHGKI